VKEFPMSSATANGRPRKQLGDQLDRLDGILDGLADALNEAVADAARDGARAAVTEILTELLTNPQFAGLRPQAAAAAPAAKPAAWSKSRAAAKAKAAGRAAAAPVGGLLATLRPLGLSPAAPAATTAPFRRGRPPGKIVRAE